MSRTGLQRLGEFLQSPIGISGIPISRSHVCANVHCVGTHLQRLPVILNRFRIRLSVVVEVAESHERIEIRWIALERGEHGRRGCIERTLGLRPWLSCPTPER